MNQIRNGRKLLTQGSFRCLRPFAAALPPPGRHAIARATACPAVGPDAWGRERENEEKKRDWGLWERLREIGRRLDFEIFLFFFLIFEIGSYGWSMWDEESWLRKIISLPICIKTPLIIIYYAHSHSLSHLIMSSIHINFKQNPSHPYTHLMHTYPLQLTIKNMLL